MSAPADQDTPRLSGPERTHAMVGTDRTEPMKEEMRSAESTLPPNVSRSYTMAEAPESSAAWVWRRANTSVEASMSPWIGMT